MIIDKIKKEIELAINKNNCNDINFLVEKCKNIKHGDFSSNVAMVLAKNLKKNPIDIANNLVETLTKSRLFDKVEVAKPGFINFWISNKEKSNLINEILNTENLFGQFQKKNINYSVEYVSANPTGYLHIGHARNAVLGNCLINVLKWYGYNVISEYVVNDAGNQMNNLAVAVLIRYQQLCGKDIKLPEDSYHGDEIIEVAKLLKSTYGDEFINATINKENRINQKEIEFKIRWFAREILLDIIKKDLHDLGVDIEKYFSEYEVHKNNLIPEIVETLKKKQMAYTKDGATWLSTTKFGDDKDRVLIKSDGTPTYFAPDIVYHLYKFNSNNTNICLDVWGADHYSYITRMKAAMECLGINRDNLIIICLQMVRLVKDGEEFKMSKRSGKSLTTRDLIDSIGKDAARWFLISQSYNNHIEIDVDVATKKDNNNPLYYVQYAHARANQLLSKVDFDRPFEYSNLNTDLEREIINELWHFKYTIENCAQTYEPYKLTTYLTSLAKLFHNYYSNTKIIDQNNLIANEQYYLVKAIKQIIHNGLTILGIEAPNKM